MERGKKRPTDDAPPRQDLDGPITARPTEKHPMPEEEINPAPEDLGRHTLVNATEAAELEVQPEEGDATIEVMVPPNQEEIEQEEETD